MPRLRRWTSWTVRLVLALGVIVAGLAPQTSALADESVETPIPFGYRVLRWEQDTPDGFFQRYGAALLVEFDEDTDAVAYRVRSRTWDRNFQEWGPWLNKVVDAPDVDDRQRVYDSVCRPRDVANGNCPELAGFPDQPEGKRWILLASVAPFVTGTAEETLADFLDTDLPAGLQRETEVLAIAGFGVGIDVLDDEGKVPDFAGPDEELTVRLRASPGGSIDELNVETDLPSKKIAKLVKGSITAGGTLRGNTITWRFSSVDETQVMEYRLRTRSRFPKDASSMLLKASAEGPDGTTKEDQELVRLEKPTLVLGTVKDAVMDFPERTSVLLKKPGKKAGVRALLLDGPGGAVLDETTLDKKGRYELEAPDPGTYEVRIEGAADRYVETTDMVVPDGATLVQTRAIEIESDQTDAERLDDIVLPLSLADDVAARLLRVNNLTLKLAGFVPLPTSLDTGGLVPEIDALLDATDEDFERIYDGTGDRDGWNALIRMNAVLAIVEARFQDNGKQADVFAKSVALLVTLEVIKKIGPKVVNKWKQRKGLDKDAYVPADMRSRTVEAIKITTLAYGVGYALPKILNQFDLTGEQKSLIIEVVAKAVRFGMNTLVPAQNEQDIVFEAIFQLLRAGIFAGFNEALFVTNAEEQLERATGMFSNRAIAGDTTATLQWLEAYDALVGDRSKENARVGGDALKQLSIIVRGLDGILFKAQQAMGFSSNKAVSAGKTRGRIQKFLGFMEKPKLAATVTAFSVAIGAPITEQLYVFQDLETETSVAFSGPAGLGDPKPPGEGLASTIGNDVLSKVDFYFGTRYAPQKRAAEQPTIPPIDEVQAYSDTLDVVEAALNEPTVDAYEAARAQMLQAHDPLFLRLRVPAARALLVLRDDPRAPDILVGIQGARSDFGSAVAVLYTRLEVWATEPGKKNAKAAVRSMDRVREILRFLSGAIVGAEDALSSRAIPPTLLITGGPDGIDVAAGATETLQFRIVNIGTQATDDMTAILEVSTGLTIQGDAELEIPALDPDEVTTISFDVLTPATSSQASYVLAVQTLGATLALDRGSFYVEP